MKKRCTKVLALVLSLAMMITLLVACGSKPAATSASASAAAGDDPFASEDVTITQLIWMPDSPDVPLNVADAFMEKYPNVTVDTQMQSGSVEESIQPKAAAKEMPDLMSIDAGSYASSLADEGLLMDLSDTDAWNNQLDSLSSQFISDGGVKFGISGGLCTTLIYYNKTMFSDAGIKDFPANYQEFLDCCKALKDKGYTPMVFTGGDANTLSNANFSYGLSQYLVKGDTAVIDQIKAGTYTFTGDAGLKKTFDRITEITKLGYCNDGWESTGYDEGMQIFNAGDAAMIFYGTWNAGTLLDDATGIDVGCVLPPWNDEGEEQIPVISSETGFACGATGSDAQQYYAKKLLEFWNGEGYALYQNPRGLVPAFKSETIKCDVVLDQRISDVIAAADACSATTPLYFNYLPTSIDQQKIIQEVLLGNLSVDDACATFDQSK